MNFIGNDIVEIKIEELAYFVDHKCRFCNFKPARCSDKLGCYEGIQEYLKEKQNEICNS